MSSLRFINSSLVDDCCVVLETARGRFDLTSTYIEDMEVLYVKLLDHSVLRFFLQAFMIACLDLRRLSTMRPGLNDFRPPIKAQTGQPWDRQAYFSVCLEKLYHH